MAYNGVIFAGTLLEINVAAAGALAVLNPLLAQIDFSLFGYLGIGALQADLQAQLSAALEASVTVSLPLEGWLQAYAAFQAQLELALSGSIGIGVQANASASFAALLSLQIGGLEAIIQAALAVRIPAVTFAAMLAAALSAGPLFVLSFENITLTQAGTSISGDFYAGLTQGAHTILPSDAAYGIVIVTKAPSAWGALQVTMLTA